MLLRGEIAGESCARTLSVTGHLYRHMDHTYGHMVKLYYTVLLVWPYENNHIVLLTNYMVALYCWYHDTYGDMAVLLATLPTWCPRWFCTTN